MHLHLLSCITLLLFSALTTVFFVAVVRAVVVVVAPPYGRYTPFVVALKLSVLTLIRCWKKSETRVSRSEGAGAACSSTVIWRWMPNWYSAFIQVIWLSRRERRSSLSAIDLVLEIIKTVTGSSRSSGGGGGGRQSAGHNSPQHEDKDSIWALMQQREEETEEHMTDALRGFSRQKATNNSLSDKTTAHFKANI